MAHISIIYDDDLQMSMEEPISSSSSYMELKLDRWVRTNQKSILRMSALNKFGKPDIIMIIELFFSEWDSGVASRAESNP